MKLSGAAYSSCNNAQRQKYKLIIGPRTKRRRQSKTTHQTHRERKCNARRDDGKENGESNGTFTNEINNFSASMLTTMRTELKHKSTNIDYLRDFIVDWWRWCCLARSSL